MSASDSAGADVSRWHRKGHYALVVMTVVAVLFLPLVLLYQGWSFHVFPHRVSAPPAPAETAGGSEAP